MVAFEARSAGVSVVREFHVVAAAITDVFVEAPATRVTGRVLQGGKPLRGDVEITIGARDDHPEAPHHSTAPVGASGGFDLTTDSAGPHRAILRVNGFRLLGVERLITLSPGISTLEWDVSLGRLTISLPNWDRSSEVLLVFRVPQPATVGGLIESEVLVQPGDRLPVIG